MNKKERIEHAEKRIKELQLLISSWNKEVEEKLPIWERKLQGDGSGFTVIEPNWDGGIK